MSKIEINNVYKIFGNNPKSVLQMVKDGATKDEVLEKNWTYRRFRQCFFKNRRRRNFCLHGAFWIWKIYFNKTFK